VTFLASGERMVLAAGYRPLVGQWPDSKQELP